jgi:hypothetical protein
LSWEPKEDLRSVFQAAQDDDSDGAVHQKEKYEEEYIEWDTCRSLFQDIEGSPKKHAYLRTEGMYESPDISQRLRR